jgi:hypothetical protein
MLLNIYTLIIPQLTLKKHYSMIILVIKISASPNHYDNQEGNEYCCQSDDTDE